MLTKILFLLTLVIIQTSQAFATEPGRIALVQYDADKYFGMYYLNRENLTRMASEAIDNDANIIVFPEGSLYGINSLDPYIVWCRESKKGCKDISKVAEEVPLGASTKYWSEISIKNKVYILFNLPEKNGDQYFNTTVIVGPTGFVGKYRKRELFRSDKQYAVPGNLQEDFVLQTEFGNFGLLICMDVTYRGFLEKYNDKNVDGVIVMLDWGHETDPQYYAVNFLRNRATAANLTLFAADMTPWNGTGQYEPKKERQRGGQLKITNKGDGISYHDIGVAD